MKNKIPVIVMGSAILLAITFLVVRLINFQATPIEKSMLWKVSGRELRTPSYLFGILKSVRQSDYLLKDKVLRAFEQVNIYVTESELLSLEAMMQRADAQKLKVPQSKRLSPEKFQLVNSLLGKYSQHNLSLETPWIDSMRLSAIVDLLLKRNRGKEERLSYDLELMVKMLKKDLYLNTMENVAQQIAYNQQADSDENALSQLTYFDTYSAHLDSLAKPYNEEDVEALYKMMTDERFMNANAKKWILQERNPIWAEKMVFLMNESACFFALDAAHLGGDDGLIRLLRARGYKVEPVFQ